ncbi:hypothetical protein ACA910_012889 [Epithemia clementina (nom. ined.)]
MEEFWKDDYRPLRWAGKAILQALRDDEQAPDADLYRRLTESNENSHLYFQSDSSLFAPQSNSATPMPGRSNAENVGAAPSPPTICLKHRQSLPLPPLLTDALKQQRTCSYMGLLLPVGLAWMTVDEKLFLFSSEDPSQRSIERFENPRKQPILAVALVKPKPGVFKKEIVEWCLVLTTSEEAMLLALARIDGTLQLMPTSFLTSTDFVQMTCAVGTDNGRIFLGGDDGCLHEMVYEDHALDDDYSSDPKKQNTVDKQLDEFYDGTKMLPDVVNSFSGPSVSETVWNLGKRSWDSVSQSNENGPRKCRKLNRTTQASSLLPSLVTNAIHRVSSVVFGAHNGGRIVRLAVDSQRRTLYCLSEKGWISVFDLGQPNNAPCIAVCDVPETAKLYLKSVSSGFMNPPNNSSSTIGSIRFPGGGSGAQAGVGGMQGARDILKHVEQADSSFSRRPGAHSMVKPVAIHVIPMEESLRLTVMAVTGGGLRLYFSALDLNFSGGPGSLSNGNRLRSFGKKLTLCHIRSPPPFRLSSMTGTEGQSTWTSDVVGGIQPRVAGSSSYCVDATFYGEGQWVVAVQQSTEYKAKSNNCDIMVAVTPDTAKRLREGGDDKAFLETAGGLNESVSFPNGAIQENGQGARVPRGLSGGSVWAIDSDTAELSSTMQLLLQSPTPSNGELEEALPPIYYPSSQIRPIATNNKDLYSGGNGAIIPASTAAHSRVFHVVLNIVLDSLFGRSLSHGFYPQQKSSIDNDQQPLYRLSKRTGVQGFSCSAVERRRSPNTTHGSVRDSRKSDSSFTHTKAARLNKWLLQPPTQSLNQWTKQHLLKRKKVVTAINQQGLHKFEFSTVLSSLADAIADAGDNVASDTKITSFFTAYGYKEGCAMCLALAIGCGPSQPNVGNSQTVRRRASTAALARAYKPNLVRKDHREIAQDETDDNCVPSGYVFRPSALCEGLYILVSRLLRPIWHKPLVVVTEGRSIKTPRSNLLKTTPAKVELLLDEAALKEILVPLESLLSVVKSVFSRAVDVVPGTLGQQVSAMDIDGDSQQQQQQYFTQALQYHSQFRSSTGDAVAPLSPKECDNIAHLLEERNIHSTYRLVALVVQLLNIFSLLRQSEGIAGLPKSNWGLLHGATVAGLVQLAEGHERLETLLNELIVATASSAASPLFQADHFSDQLVQQCYLFFPPSSRFTYQGLRLANQALAHPPGSSQRSESGKLAASHLIQAAKHWKSASLISGRLVGRTGTETYYQIAERAIKYSSPLAIAADLLVKLEDVCSVVEICLTTAQNFKTSRMPLGSKDVLRYDGMFAWEADLYHKQVGPTEEETTRDGSQRNSSSEVYGSSVSAKDAIKTCHSLIFVHLEGLLRSKVPLANLMVAECVSDKDKTFLKSLFSFLIESSNVDTLLRINSPEAEMFLKEQNDSNLLWRHFSVLEKFVEAGHVAYDCARSDDTIRLGDRIEWLTKALQSFRSAQNAYRGPDSKTSGEQLAKFVAETEDNLKIATVQDRVVRRIESLPDFPEEIDHSKFEKLKTHLVEATPLYNEFVAKVPLFDLCLVMLHMCRHNDSHSITILWKNAICEVILPCCTRSSDMYESLLEFAGEVDLADRVTHLSDTMEAGSVRLFEDGNWVVPVHDLVVRLGRELYGSGADYTFPVRFILEQLEVLRCTLGSKLASGWPLTTLAEAGVPYLVILEAFENIADLENSSNNPRRSLEHISASIELFLFWISNSRAAGLRAGQHSAAQIELSRSASTGDLRPKLNLLRSRLEQIQVTGSPLLEELNGIEDSISLLVSM